MGSHKRFMSYYSEYGGCMKDWTCWVRGIFLAGCLGTLIPPSLSSAVPDNVYAFTVRDIDGHEVSLSKFSGSPLLIVNTASKCGFTPQYASLEQLYKKYRDRGLRILAFPSNDFRNQEPGSDAEIKEFCNLRFNITFDLFSKIKVLGPGADPLYIYLTGDSRFPGPITWNFNKFLISPEGEISGRFDSSVDPLSPKITAKIEELLSPAV